MSEVHSMLKTAASRHWPRGRVARSASKSSDAKARLHRLPRYWCLVSLGSDRLHEVWRTDSVPAPGRVSLVITARLPGNFDTRIMHVYSLIASSRQQGVCREFLVTMLTLPRTTPPRTAFTEQGVA